MIKLNEVLFRKAHGCNFSLPMVVNILSAGSGGAKMMVNHKKVFHCVKRPKLFVLSVSCAAGLELTHGALQQHSAGEEEMEGG